MKNSTPQKISYWTAYVLVQEELAAVQLASTLADHDALIPVWKEKIRYDAVRPLTAIKFIYGKKNVTSWGGPGKGTVQIPADEWRSYLGDADHPGWLFFLICFILSRYYSKDFDNNWIDLQ